MSDESKQTPWRYFFRDGEFHAHEDGCWMDAKDYDALLAERDRIASDRDAKTARMWELGKECDALTQRVEQMTEALKKYGDHYPECAVIQECGLAVKPLCNCGFDAALTHAGKSATTHNPD